MSVHCSSPATAAVDDAGADAAADATYAGDHHGQDDKGEDGPDPPARPALPLRPTGSNIGSALLLAGAYCPIRKNVRSSKTSNTR